jgi:hypothetical protein
MKEIFIKALWMVKENSFGKMEEFILVNFKMEKCMEWEF